MKHLPFSLHSFKIKLLVSLLAVGLLPLATISVFYQYILDVRITKISNPPASTGFAIPALIFRGRKEIADQLLGWITYNRQLQNILTSDYSRDLRKKLDIIQFVLTLWNTLSMPISKAIFLKS